MSDKIANTDGSVYMTFPPTVPRVEPVRFTIRHVQSWSNPVTPEYGAGTLGFPVQVTRSTFRGVLEARTELTRLYGERYVWSASGFLSDGRPWYRYSWERHASWHGVITDTLWIIRDLEGLDR